MNWKTEIALARELIDETEVLLRAEGGFSMDLAHRKALHAIERQMKAMFKLLTGLTGNEERMRLIRALLSGRAETLRAKQPHL